MFGKIMLYLAARLLRTVKHGGAAHVDVLLALPGHSVRIYWFTEGTCSIGRCSDCSGYSHGADRSFVILLAENFLKVIFSSIFSICHSL